jgi:hypothetical protein
MITEILRAFILQRITLVAAVVAALTVAWVPGRPCRSMSQRRGETRHRFR